MENVSNRITTIDPAQQEHAALAPRTLTAEDAQNHPGYEDTRITVSITDPRLKIPTRRLLTRLDAAHPILDTALATSATLSAENAELRQENSRAMRRMQAIVDDLISKLADARAQVPVYISPGERADREQHDRESEYGYEPPSVPFRV